MSAYHSLVKLVSSICLGKRISIGAVRPPQVGGPKRFSTLDASAQNNSLGKLIVFGIYPRVALNSYLKMNFVSSVLFCSAWQVALISQQFNDGWASRWWRGRGDSDGHDAYVLPGHDCLATCKPFPPPHQRFTWLVNFNRDRQARHLPVSFARAL